MNPKSEQALVGLFVIVATAVLIGTVLAISGAFGRSTHTYHTYVAFAGGVQLKVQVFPAPTAVVFAPANVCSIYCNGADAPQVSQFEGSMLSCFSVLHVTCVRPSVGVKLPC